MSQSVLIAGMTVSRTTRLPVRVNDLGDATGALAVTPMNLSNTMRSADVATVTGAYAPGQCIGVAVGAALAFDVAGGRAKLDCLTVIDTAGVRGAITILVCKTSLADWTIADKSAPTVGTASNVLHALSVTADDYVMVGTGTAYATLPNLNLRVINGDATQYLYFLVIAQGTQNYAGSNKLSLVCGLTQG